MSWDKEIEELRHREELAKRMGGPEKIARHHNQGKMTVRDRIDALLDPDSFHEIGTATGVGDYDESGALKEVVSVVKPTSHVGLEEDRADGGTGREE